MTPISSTILNRTEQVPPVVGLVGGGLRWFEKGVAPPDRPLRLICFPHAGASAFVFSEWHKLLPESIGVLPIQLPGRGERMGESPYRRLTSLLDDICPAILPFLDRPFALFGHSLGALIAFELAKRLEFQHSCVAKHLFVSGHRDPTCPAMHEDLYRLPTPAFVSALRQYSTTLCGLLGDPDALDVFLPILRADFELLETYVYEPGLPLSCPITVLAGRDDISVPHEHLAQWRLQTTVACSIHTLSGDHFFVMTNRGRVVQLIGETLRP